MFYMTEKHVPLDPHEPSREGTSTQTRNCRRFLFQVPSGHSYGLGPDFGTTDGNDREQVVELRLVVEEIQEVSYCFSRHMTCFSDRYLNRDTFKSNHPQNGRCFPYARTATKKKTKW